MESNQTQDWAAAAASFAGEHIAPLTGLSKSKDFPFDLWQKMGKAGLLGIGIERQYGGASGSYALIAQAASLLVEHGHNLGMAASFLIHNMVARFAVQRLGSQSIKDSLLPTMASGDKTVSVAMSEPKTGAHPRLMATTAVKSANGWLINGQKAYLTNGPIADAFVVVAATGGQDRSRTFGAFLVTKNTPGLSILPPMDIGFLLPAPHGAIRLENVFVPPHALMGTPDNALNELVKPFRTVEDALMTGPATGALSRQLELIAGIMRSKNTPPTTDMEQALGLFESLVFALKTLSGHTAAKIDEADLEAASRINIAFRYIADEARCLINRLLGETSLEKEGELATL
ncbi:MAG: acyl-CoA dehydrogenase family protein, partial [Desulfatibacillaceae bacterium]|nr:acyl-CoA dehydrogenase family protein [Desulfatibacillaceae bacterium]